MKDEQERQFQALVRAQQADRKLFQSWMDREVRAGGTPAAQAPPTHVPLTKMGPQNDPEAFIHLFEKDAPGLANP